MRNMPTSVCVRVWCVYIYIHSFGDNFLCVDMVLFICWPYVGYVFFSTYGVAFGLLEVGYKATKEYFCGQGLY